MKISFWVTKHFNLQNKTKKTRTLNNRVWLISWYCLQRHIISSSVIHQNDKITCFYRPASPSHKNIN